MKGHFYKRGCKCKKNKCTCGSKWAFTLDIGIDPVTGKRKQKVRSGFKTKEEAEAAAAMLIHELYQGIYVKETYLTFCEFANQWLPIYREAKDVKPGTIRVRIHEINKLLPYFAQLKLKDITSKRYQDALNDLKDRGYSNSTREGIHRTGRMIFRKAIELELIKKDPTEFAYLKKNIKTIEQFEEEEIPKYLEKEELALFLKTAKNQGLALDYLVFLILSYIGIRVGELVALKWKDIDFVNQTISITKTYYNPNNNSVQFQLVTPKTKKSRRKIVVDEDVIKSLTLHKEIQTNIIQLLGDAYYNQDFIFAKTERHLGYPIVIKMVQLRMDRLGHTDDQITKNVYLHVTKEMKKEASQKFAQLMRSLDKNPLC